MADHSPGNGKEPDWGQLVLQHVANMATFLELESEYSAAYHGEQVTATLMAAPASMREALYGLAKTAIAKLPAKDQAAAYCYARITPDKPDLIGALARAVGVDEPEPAAEDEIPLPHLVPDVPVINPALDYANGIVYIAQQRTVMGEDGVLRSIPIIFTSERKFFLCPQVKVANEIKLINTRVAIDKTLERAGQRWSLPAIQQFIDLGGLVDPWQLYIRLESVYRERIWFAEDSNYVLFALYTMLSYVFPIFDAVPYLHLTGLGGSGKTHAATLLATLAFNGHVEIDPTDATLFRTIERTRGLVVLDDQEVGVTNRKYSDNPFMTILKTGYKRGGLVTRLERRGNEFVPQFFDAYCPKIITNVFGLEDILADRTIPIVMREIPAGLDRPINTSQLTRDESQPLVDDLFLFAMTHMPAIASLARQPSQYRNRSEEIFAPLIVLATYVDSHCPGQDRSLLAEISEALDIATIQRQVTRSQTPEQNLRLALLNLLEARGKDEGWFSARDIELEFYKLHSVPPDWFSDIWLGKNIGKVVNLRKQDRRRDPTDQEYPRLDHKTGRIAQRFDGLLGCMVNETEYKRLTHYYIRREAL